MPAQFEEQLRQLAQYGDATPLAPPAQQDEPNLLDPDGGRTTSSVPDWIQQAVLGASETQLRWPGHFSDLEDGDRPWPLGAGSPFGAPRCPPDSPTRSSAVPCDDQLWSGNESRQPPVQLSWPEAWLLMDSDTASQTPQAAAEAMPTDASQLPDSMLPDRGLTAGQQPAGLPLHGQRLAASAAAELPHSSSPSRGGSLQAVSVETVQPPVVHSSLSLPWPSPECWASQGPCAVQQSYPGPGCDSGEGADGAAPAVHAPGYAGIRCISNVHALSHSCPCPCLPCTTTRQRLVHVGGAFGCSSVCQQVFSHAVYACTLCVPEHGYGALVIHRAQLGVRVDLIHALGMHERTSALCSFTQPQR